MARKPIPTWFFALVIVRRGEQFLLVQEAKPGQPWFFPAGRVEPGETMQQGALRETLEEAGIVVELDGILKFEHTPGRDGARVRVLFLAHPVDESPPKSVADAESLQAGWFTLAEIARLALRGQEVLQLCQAVAAGAPVAPLSFLEREAGA